MVLCSTNPARSAYTDPAGFEIDSRFESGSTLELITHMCRRGLEFAKPQPGDVASYRRVFYAMRDVLDQQNPNAELDFGLD